LLEGVRGGESGLLVNFQETPAQLARIMRHFGWEPEKLLGPGKLDQFYTSPVELQVDTILTELFQRVEAQDVRRVVIDSLGDLERSAPDRLRFRDYLYALSQQLATRGITSMLLQETTDTDRGGRANGWDVSNLSGNILLLETHLDGDLTRTIRILKARGSAHDGRRRVLRITSQGIVVE
jgi:circadian clock protein KaiC